MLGQRDWIGHTYEVISVLETTLQRITDAETGHRGYLLTGDKSYLAPYHHALTELYALPEQLQVLVKDSPAQLQRVKALGEALSTKEAELSLTVAMRDHGEIENVKTELSSNAGCNHMDRTRSIIAQMRRAETDLLLQRTVTAQKTEKHMLEVALGCALASLLVRAMLFTRTRARS
ncbi:CHASE3 domain-containing protein [Caballeronia sp. KNU42]